MNLQPIQTLEQAVHFMQTLPTQRQQQVYEFLDMMRVYELQNQEQNSPLKTKNAGRFSDIFGMVKAKKGVSLEDMDNAIAKCGAKL